MARAAAAARGLRGHILHRARGRGGGCGSSCTVAALRDTTVSGAKQVVFDLLRLHPGGKVAHALLRHFFIRALQNATCAWTGVRIGKRTAASPERSRWRSPRGENRGWTLAGRSAPRCSPLARSLAKPRGHDWNRHGIVLATCASRHHIAHKRRRVAGGHAASQVEQHPRLGTAQACARLYRRVPLCPSLLYLLSWFLVAFPLNTISDMPEWARSITTCRRRTSSATFTTTARFRRQHHLKNHSNRRIIFTELGNALGALATPRRGGANSHQPRHAAP